MRANFPKPTLPQHYIFASVSRRKIDSQNTVPRGEQENARARQCSYSYFPLQGFLHIPPHWKAEFSFCFTSSFSSLGRTMNENITKICRICLTEGSRNIFQRTVAHDALYNVSSLSRISEKLRYVTLLKVGFYFSKIIFNQLNTTWVTYEIMSCQSKGNRGKVFHSLSREQLVAVLPRLLTSITLWTMLII